MTSRPWRCDSIQLALCMGAIAGVSGYLIKCGHLQMTMERREPMPGGPEAMPESHWINAIGKQPRSNAEDRIRRLRKKYRDEERRCEGQRASRPVESHSGSATKVSCNTAQRACTWACWLCCDVGLFLGLYRRPRRGW
jgi:hypothetical protein